VADEGARDDDQTVAPPTDGDDVPSGVWCETGSARAAIAAAIRASVDQLDSELPRARLGNDPEGVHQARVATRRLRSDLRTYGPLLDASWREATRAELKWLADALGAVRDADVLSLRLAEAVTVVAIDADAAAAISARLDEQRNTARSTLDEVLDGPRTASLLHELRRSASDPPTTLSALGRAELRLRPLVRRPWRKLARAVDRLGKEPSAAELHRVRLLAKRSRYAAEAVIGVYGKDARRFAAAVRQVQDVLGDMNDAQVAIAWLRDAAPELDPSVAFAAGELAQHFQGIADAHHHGWERAFARARKRSRWLD
jgi:CHAD domain-containing protein